LVGLLPRVGACTRPLSRTNRWAIGFRPFRASPDQENPESRYLVSCEDLPVQATTDGAPRMEPSTGGRFVGLAELVPPSGEVAFVEMIPVGMLKPFRCRTGREGAEGEQQRHQR